MSGRGQHVFAVGEAASVSRQLPFSSGPQMNHTAAADRGSPVSLRSGSNSPHAQHQVSSVMCCSSFVAFSQQSQLSGAGNTCLTEACTCEYLTCKTFTWSGLPPVSCTALVHWIDQECCSVPTESSQHCWACSCQSLLSKHMRAVLAKAWTPSMLALRAQITLNPTWIS